MTYTYPTKGKKNERLITYILLVFRNSILLFSAMLVLNSGGIGLSLDLSGIVLVCFGTFQILASLMYIQIMKNGLGRLLFCGADMLMAQMAVFLTGGIYSPFIVCSMIPIFTLHFIYKTRGIVYGMLMYLISSAAILLTSKGNLPILAGNENVTLSLVVIAISLIVFYIIPHYALRQYFYNSFKVKSLEDKYNYLDDINSKLLVLYEMTGRFNYECGIAQVMERMLVVCKDIFKVERVCIFLIRSGEVEIYGKPTPQEKEDIYRLIMEQKTGIHQQEEIKYFYDEGVTMIPIVRGAMIDGVLSLNGWQENEFSNKEVILFTMAASMICTYLENLEYVESLLPPPHHNDTSILVNHLDSGKLVKGILDKRIIPS